MRHSRKNKHFLLHTLEHLFGVFVVLAVAFSLGYIAKVFNAGSAGMLASTGDATTASSTMTMTSAGYPVTFSAAYQGGGCVNGATAAKYHFTVTPELGGYVSLNSASGVDYIDATNGRGFDRYLPVGVYGWSGFPKSGFVGGTQGTFTVSEMCVPGTTASSSNTTSPTGTTPPAPTLTEAVFAVQPNTYASCDQSTMPLTNTTVLVLPVGAGEVVVSSNTGMSNAHLEAGEYPLPNGHYTWSASVRSGYVGVEKLNGYFDINNVCSSNPAAPIMPPQPPTVATATPTPTTTVMPTSTPTPKLTVVVTTSTPITQPDATQQLPPRPQLSLLIDSVKITPSATRVMNKEQLEVRTITAMSSSVDLFVVDGIGGTKLLGHAEQDDLLSRAGQDVWGYIWDLAKFPEGTVKLYSRVKHTNGTETVSERISITVKHPTEVKMTIKPVTANMTDTAQPTSAPVPVKTTAEERNAILARISDPSSCANAEECRIYCNTLPGVNELCAQFAQQSITEGVLPAPASLADGLPDERLAQLLDGGEKRAKELPPEIEKPSDLRDFCADTAHADLCTKVLVKNDMGAPEVLLAKRESIERAREEERQVFTERTGARAFVDTDNDGVTDYDEVNLYLTDPKSSDTDQDGFQDGAELLARTNPRGGEAVLTASSTGTTTVHLDESVKFYSPIVAGVTEKKLLTVKNVEVAELGTDEAGTSTIKKLKLSGVALPNSFVTVYVFSDPIVVTVKADATGAWTYTLDKELPNGTHQVYSAITDAGGRILAKSEPLPFVKEAAAVSFGSATLLPANEEPGFFSGTSLYAMIAILIGILGIAFSIIGFVVKQKDEGLPGI